MLTSQVIAIFLTACLTIFASINLHNITKSNASKQGSKYKAEVEHPSGPIFALAALGTVIFFLESVLYIILVFTGLHTIISRSLLQLQFPFDSWVQSAGIIMTAFGYTLFIWSVLARGKYATSWEMPENQKLVTWGPYSYVRHPSYLAYFILFIGLFFTLLNLIAVIPFIAIPGYIHITTVEEELLTKRFGGAYLKYQSATGRFFPRKKQRVRPDLN